MKKPLILIIGRTSAGKDTFAKMLSNMGLQQVISHTTRPKRFATENTHIFHEPDNVEQYTHRLANTNINGYEYFVTDKDLDGKSIYIIDPEGLKTFVKNVNNREFIIVYLSADDETRQARYERRQVNPHPTFKERNNAEQEQFDHFEQQLQQLATGQKDIFGKNCQAVYSFYQTPFPQIIKLLQTENYI